MLYPAWVISYGMLGMEDGFHGMGDEFHIFFTFFISQYLNPYGISSFEILVKSSIYNVLNKTKYINFF